MELSKEALEASLPQAPRRWKCNINRVKVACQYGINNDVSHQNYAGYADSQEEEANYLRRK